MVTRASRAPFVENPGNDPVLKLAERMVRCGSAAPPLSFCAVNLLAIVVESIPGLHMVRFYYVLPVLIFFVLGQVTVWFGMRGLRKCRGWDSGVLFYLWAGAFFTSLTTCAAGIFPPALIPWLAPLVAVLAKRRARRGQREGETEPTA